MLSHPNQSQEGADVAGSPGHSPRRRFSWMLGRVERRAASPEGGVGAPREGRALIDGRPRRSARARASWPIAAWPHRLDARLAGELTVHKCAAAILIKRRPTCLLLTSSTSE